MLRSILLFFLLAVSGFAQDEASIKSAVESRYQDWLAAANKKDAVAMLDLYDDNAVLLPKSEE